ncbi:AN1 zinc finger protein [Pyrenophora tritici-repentis Pt-1C-BFP]|uniref:AN1 zinc finger protein n=1 Tax=Pyrenophora tritici-repentis (strain Pt-1C-BFP) TaxID=426418 RepID=B2VX62_PYRTR|nr:AN1 zinc finger protein [Pyrenophora tritici-repentis Pt-1C-BFP]EDU45631.1 AN1 zinc finger protein [Pyrenophora tritici-repentis Pt-1C-BFP]
MASSNDSSYTEMKGEVEAIGAHCQMEYCHVLDFLPFRCESCQGKFCLDHRTEHAHACTKAGDWARRRAAQNALTSTNTPLTPKPSLYTHEQQCYERAPRLQNIPRRGVTPLGGARQQTMSALMKLKLWAENKKKEDEKRRGAAKKTGGFLGLGKSSSSAASTAQAELNALKRTAKGEASVPQEKRVYLHVEASADTTKAKYPTGKFFYNKDWTVGRVLDMAAKALQVQNVNNHGGGEEEKLRVFHVEGGRLLKFNEKIGESCSSGNMIVLLRGVGSGEAPDLIDL